MIQIKRVYLPASIRDGKRFLVDRLWPRGISREKAKLSGWIREAAPSPELRQWFHHDPQKWSGFQKRYQRELAENRQALSILLESARKGTITLLFGAKDPEYNNAVVLQKYLKSKMKKSRSKLTGAGD